MSKKTKILLINIVGIIVGGVAEEICSLLVKYITERDETEKLENK